MRSSAKNIKLTSVDDLFSTQESRDDAQKERVQILPLADFHPFPDHPFKVLDNEDMMKMVESIEKYGMLTPALARPDGDGGYQIVAGHRRHHACILAGLDTMPTIVRDIDDDTAAILMVDSNLQRENILPSERAFAYKIKLDAMKRQGNRSDLTCGQVGHKLKAREIMAQETNESGRQIQRYIRLTELIPDLLDMVDERRIAFSPAVELSYLKPQEQLDLLDAMDMEQATPSLSQAQRLKKCSSEGRCSHDAICAIMSEEKKPETSKITFSSDKLQRYFPKSYTPQRMEETILKLLESWQKKRSQSQER